MCSNTLLLDFSVDPSHLSQDGLASVENSVISSLTQLLGQDLEKVISKSLSPLGESLSLFVGPRASSFQLKSYPSGLITLNIDYWLEEGEKPLLSLESVKKLEAAILTSLEGQGQVRMVKSFPALKRGAKIDVYMTTTDERLMEYDIDAVVFDDKSEFQHVQILHSKSFGNMLVLDDLQNLAESDLIYTESLMCRGTEDYGDKEILILGGGDGALLYELRKEHPKFITMIEIDNLVMQICKLHLRSACGDTLDNYKGENYEIIVGDCVPFMKSCINEGKKFDYVFADLTDIPISQTPQGEIWDFIRQILNLSFSILSPGGKYMTHGNGSSSPQALKMYEDQLQKLDVPVKYSKSHAFVPSFMEDWVFYQIWAEKQ